MNNIRLVSYIQQQQEETNCETSFMMCFKNKLDKRQKNNMKWNEFYTNCCCCCQYRWWWVREFLCVSVIVLYHGIKKLNSFIFHKIESTITHTSSSNLGVKIIKFSLEFVSFIFIFVHFIYSYWFILFFFILSPNMRVCVCVYLRMNECISFFPIVI